MREHHGSFLKRAKEQVQHAFQSRDMLLVNTSKSIADTDRVIHLLSERLNEWYGVYFPELKHDDQFKYAKLVLEIDKKNPDSEKIAKIIGQEKTEDLKKQILKSLGADLEDRDVAACRCLAERILMLYDLRKQLEDYEKELAKEICPNISAVAGEEVAAKLIAHVGSLYRLAMLPSSTVQVLGAEKALFKHLKNRKIDPPKHGIIFLHASISSSPKKIRGKIARLLANKIAIAAKADFFTKNDISKLLLEEFRKRHLKIKEEYERKKEQKI